MRKKRPLLPHNGISVESESNNELQKPTVKDNNYQIHLQERIKNANKTYFMLQKFFKNKNIFKKLKLILKNTIIDKTLAYALETSTLTKRDRK